MALANRSLVLDFLEWVALEPRAYRDVMQTWHTHCPRLTIWEDAVDLGLVARAYRVPAGSVVEISADGLALLQSEGRI